MPNIVVYGLKDMSREFRMQVAEKLGKTLAGMLPTTLVQVYIPDQASWTNSDEVNSTPLSSRSKLGGGGDDGDPH
jgi:hypothetical protein